MPDIVSYIPIILISIGIARAIRKVRPVVLQAFIAVIASIFASAILGVAPEIIKPSTTGEGGMGWAIILAATWAIVAVPTTLFSMALFNSAQRRKEMSAPKREEIGICTCPCHEKPHSVVHPIECCEMCPNCRKGIACGMMEAHLQSCSGRSSN